MDINIVNPLSMAFSVCPFPLIDLSPFFRPNASPPMAINCIMACS